MGFRVGPGDGAEDLGHTACAHGGHRPCIAIRRLNFQPSPIDRTSIQTRRCSRLEAGHRQGSIAHLCGKLLCRGLTDPPANDAFLTTKERATQERAGTQDRGGCFKPGSIRQLDADHPALLQLQRSSLTCNQGQIPLQREHTVDGCLEQFAVCLNSRPLHGAALGAVQHAIMDRSGICGTADQAIERIDFTHQMAFAKPADGRIAAHRPDRIKIETDKGDAGTHSRSNSCRFAAGMAAADYDDVKGMHGPSAYSTCRRGSKHHSRRALFHVKHHAYLPMQNRPNSESSMSSVVE